MSAELLEHPLLQALYARRAARYPSFHEPQLGWWRRRRVPKADKADEGELAVLEDRLSLEEIAHFRAGKCPDCMLCASLTSSGHIERLGDSAS